MYKNAAKAVMLKRKTQISLKGQILVRGNTFVPLAAIF